MKLVDWKEMIIVGIPVSAQWRGLWEQVPKAWARLFEQVAVLEEIGAGPFVDVSLEEIDSVYSQLIGVPLKDGGRIPDGFKAVCIPAQKLLHHRHIGDVKDIANSFGEMYSWADKQGLRLSAFKLDLGYTMRGDETEHDLYVGLRPEIPWSYVASDANTGCRISSK